MIKCYKCTCTSPAAFECLKKDYIVYTCQNHVINEPTSLPIEYNSIQHNQIKSLKTLISTKQTLLNLLGKIIANLKTKWKPVVSLKPKHPSNQFLMAGLVIKRQMAGQKQDRVQAHLFKVAIKGLQEYPLPIIHPEQALDIQGIGPSFTKFIHKLFQDNRVNYKNLKKNEKEKEKKNEYQGQHNDVEVKLYVDVRETRGNNIVSIIEKNQIQFVVKTLALGDYIFVAETINKDYVLDVIIERKTSSDLNSSHFSNHLRDQIRRLKCCKINLKILLVEGKANYEILAEIWLKHGISIILLGSQKKTVKLMGSFQKYFSQKFWNTDGLGELGEFPMFQEQNAVCNNVGEIFYRQLLEFPGMTVKKLNLFVGLYPTMIDFLRSYKENNVLVHQNLLWCGIKAGLELILYKFFGIKH